MTTPPIPKDRVYCRGYIKLRVTRPLDCPNGEKKYEKIPMANGKFTSRIRGVYCRVTRRMCQTLVIPDHCPMPVWID